MDPKKGAVLRLLADTKERDDAYYAWREQSRDQIRQAFYDNDILVDYLPTCEWVFNSAHECIEAPLPTELVEIFGDYDDSIRIDPEGDGPGTRITIYPQRGVWMVSGYNTNGATNKVLGEFVRIWNLKVVWSEFDKTRITRLENELKAYEKLKELLTVFEEPKE